MISIATALHALAAVVWVGGMFFAYMAMRPAVGPLAPAERLALWRRTFDRFFLWVWASIAVLLVTGYWIVFGELGGFGGAGAHIHIMQAVGLLMIALFLHLWFAPFGRLRKALAASDLKTAAAQIDQIRMIVGINLVLGLVTVAIGASGRYWG
ncbi:putative membrane protein [Constrictibacter sp. MBR-5]|jgi:uncharacterized membrane protein|uniref:CopD family protein n=1 Tax=Constrictibacter sp. MBR-5 TaxID=3156467 RepID=UPI003395F71C